MYNFSSAGHVIDALAVISLLASLLLIIAKRLDRMIRIVAVQAWTLASLAAVVGYATGNWHMYLAAVLTVVVKALAIPWFALYIVDKIGIQRETEHFLSSKVSLLVGVGLVMLAYYVVAPDLGGEQTVAGNSLPISLAMILIGLFVMISRKKAIAQMMGVIVMENGLFLTALAMTSGMPLVVELGIFFDLFVGVLIMGILSFRINQTFDSINVTRLQRLKG